MVFSDSLVGRWPEDAATYKARAPIAKVEDFSCPVLFLHGDEDKIVPPNQATLMHAALKAKGLPTALRMYEGEQHGFRKSENVIRALEAELAFFGEMLGFAPAGVLPPIEIIR